MLEELQEEPLRPAVERRLVRGDLAIPVDRPAHAAHLLADRRDVPLGDLARVAALLDRGVLGREAERVVAHRAQHREAVPAAKVRDDVPERVVQDVAHVQVGRGVREHLEHVEARSSGAAAGCRVRRPRTHARPPRPPATSARSSARRSVHRSISYYLQRRKSLSSERPWEAAAASPRGFLGQVRSRFTSPSVTMVSACSQRFRPLSDLFPDTATVADGELSIGGVRATRARGRFGTPLVVYDEATVRAQARAYRAAAPDAFVVYGTKAFPSVAMLRLLAEEGLGADVSTSGELAFALAAGNRGEQLVVHGNNKEDELLRGAAEVGALVVLDSLEELAGAAAAFTASWSG